FQPKLNCDVAVIFDADITDLLIDILSGRQESSGTEDRVPLRLAGGPSPLSDDRGGVLERYPRIARQVEGLGPRDRRGFVQFDPAPGVADSFAKCSMMRSYLDRLGDLVEERDADQSEVALNTEIPGHLDL